MRKIRVLQVLEATVGGTRRHLSLLVTHLDPSRFEVSVICSVRRDPSFIEDLRRMEEREVEVAVVSMTRHISPLKDLFACLRIWRLIRQRRCDIVHTHSSKAGVLGRMAARLVGVPVILHSPHGFAFQADLGKMKSSFYRGIERVMGRLTTRLVCVSESEREIALVNRIAYKHDMNVIPNAVDPSWWDVGVDGERKRREIGIPPDHLIVGMVGDLRPQKGYEYYLDAAAQVLKHFPNVTFLILGDGALREELERRVRRLNIEKSVRMMGYRADIAEIYPLMDVFVLTSLWEGMPYSILEAMAARRPVVATRIPGSQDVVLDGITGMLVPPRDKDAIAQAIPELLHDPTKRKNMGEEGKRRVEDRYELQNQIESLEALYEDMLAHRV